MNTKILPLVSIIIPTKNEEKNIYNCLESVKEQTYKNIEIIVIDNNSTDKTFKISKKYTSNVFNQGPERSAQRNFGAKKSSGKYLLFLDADMILTTKVVEECVKKIEDNGGIIIPEKSFGIGFWAQCKALERSFYVGVDAIEAARFYNKKIFEEVKGYSIDLISGEDWELSQKVKKRFGISRISEYILHNEGKLSLLEDLKKKYYYSKHINNYIINNKSFYKNQGNIWKRYKLFFRKPKKLFINPILGLGMLFMKTCEFGVGGIGYKFKL